MILEFESFAEMERWFAENHSTSEGFWLRFYKRDSKVASVRPPEALEVLLCYGWITGQARPHDERSWLGRMVPRRPGSIWSKVNVAMAERLIEEGRMKPAGLQKVNEAKADGRWHRAYSPHRSAVFPPDFLEALGKNKSAEQFSKTLSRANSYAIIFRLETAKDPSLRKRKIAAIVRMLEEGKTFH
ncbi:MAG: YdeI/OmpD-associated family protein [Nitrososphaerota archaeon]|nr:YdeI/OmpD-associated family protein [Nitrososphaerota archaeon]